MSMEFGKLNFAVGFNRTSAFPLDANSYFENYNNAVTAAAGAAEVGSSDSAYYVGQLIIVKDTTKGVGLYQISADKKLVKFGQASSADELTADLATLKGRFNNLVRDLPATEGEDGAFTLLEPSESIPLGFFKNEEKVKLAGIAAGAQVNKIESVKVNGTALDIDESKAVNIDLSAYAKTTDMNKKVASVTAEDGSITVGGTATDPTVKVAIAAGDDNALTLATDGLKVVVPAAAEYSIKKLDAANDGMSASYQLTKNGTGVGTVIDIPKDMVVKSGTVETYKAGSLPTGVDTAGTYIVLVLANDAEDKLYINVDGLIEYVTGGSGENDAIQINVTSDTHKVTASVKEGSLTLAMMDAGVKASLAKADSAVQKVEAGTTNGTIKVDSKEVAVAGLQDAAYATVESLNATAQDKVDAAKTALIGKEADTDAADTIKGAKKYADKVAAASADINYTDTAAEKKFVTAVNQTKGKIEVTREALKATDIPTIEQSQVNGLEAALNGKQDTVTFNTAYDAGTNKAATMSDVNAAKTALVGVAASATADDNTIEGAKKYAEGKASAAETAAKAYADSIVSGDGGITKRVEDLENKHAEGKTVAEEVTAGIDALDLSNTYAAKATTEAHIANNDIHVTAAKKTAWDGAVTDVATLKGEESVAGSVKAIAKSYADGKDEAIADAKAAGTAASTALGTYKTSNDARVKAIEDKEATWNGKQDAITDGSAVIATVAEGVVTLKAGVGQNKGAVAQGTGADITLAKVATTGAAVDIAVADTAEKFTATDLEAVLAELADSIQVGGTGSKVTCEKTSPEGVAARYVFKQGGVAIENATIDIPKDMVVKSGTVVTKAEAGAWGEAGTYLELTLANATNDKVYINVGDLIEYVTSGSAAEDSVQVAVSADHKVTASIKDGSVALGKLATTVQAQINKAHEHANKTVIDGITAEKVAKWDATDTAIGEAVEAGVAELDFTDAAVAGQYVDKVDQVDGIIKPHRVDLPTATAAALGLVKVDDTTIAVNAGVISVKAVSTDLLTQGTEELILNGGTSAI